MSVIKAEHIKDYMLKLTFYDGKEKTIDFEKGLKTAKIYLPYLKRKKFLKLKVDNGNLRWPGNVLDFHYDQLIKMKDIKLIEKKLSKSFPASNKAISLDKKNKHQRVAEPKEKKITVTVKEKQLDALEDLLFCELPKEKKEKYIKPVKNFGLY